MEANVQKKKRKRHVSPLHICLWAAILFFLYHLICNQVVIAQLKDEKSGIEKKIAAMAEKGEKARSAEDIYSSPEYVEKLAREKFGFVYPDEKVFYDVSGK